MKDKILELLTKHKSLTGRQIGEQIDPLYWSDHIHLDLQTLVDENKIIRNPLLPKEWDIYTWSLKC